MPKILVGVFFSIAYGAWSGNLDTLQMKTLYRDGDFQECTQSLEKAMAKSQSLSNDEKAFSNKYLGVIYASNPVTEEKGRYYLNQFLQIRPDGTIIDLYASKKIKDIFQEVREEFLATGENPPQVDAKPASHLILNNPESKPIPKSPKHQPIPMPSKPKEKADSKSNAWLWIAGTAAVSGALAAGYFLMTPGEKKVQTTEYVIHE